MVEDVRFSHTGGADNFRVVLEQFVGNEILVFRVQVQGILAPFIFRGLSLMLRGIPHKEVNHVNAKSDDDGKTHNHITGKPIGS